MYNNFDVENPDLGQSLAKLMSSERDTESIQTGVYLPTTNSVRYAHCPTGQDARKRSGDSITRHPLNKKRRISIDNVSSNVKTDTVNRLPDQTKVDLFNAFVKSAFPDFDNLLMASWNVVSIFVNVGSEDLMLHNSIGDLHEVLLRFDDFFGKSKRKMNPNGGAGKLFPIFACSVLAWSHFAHPGVTRSVQKSGEALLLFFLLTRLLYQALVTTLAAVPFAALRSHRAPVHVMPVLISLRATVFVIDWSRYRKAQTKAHIHPGPSHTTPLDLDAQTPATMSRVVLCPTSAITGPA